jgi:site-specific DNA-methyltransferase (cytosine-N4-specific)
VTHTNPHEGDLEYFFDNIHQCRDKNYLTHGLHPYPAKFIPHIPRALLTHFAEPEMPVLDPMCGSGTTVVEATLMGFEAIGVDLNPVATLVSKVKSSPLKDAHVRELDDFSGTLRSQASHAEQLVSHVNPPEFPNRDKWFDAQVAKELTLALAQAEVLSSDSRAVARQCVSAVLVAVSNQESETRWRAIPHAVAPGMTMIRIADRLDSSLKRLSEYREMNPAPAQVITADARQLPLGAGTIGTIITSPPYANSHDYYLYNKLRMFFLGYNVDRVQELEIGSRNRHSDRKAPIDHYLDAMRESLIEWRRVLVDGGHCIVIVADAVIRGELFEMSRELSREASKAGFSLTNHHFFSHRQFNSTFQRGFGTRQDKLTHVLTYS